MAHLRRSPSSGIDAALVSRLWRDAGAARWSLSNAQFTAVIERSLEHRFRVGEPDAATTRAYLESLHVTDLALAAACALGNEAAWEHFVLQFRPVLYRLAIALGGERGRELADSLYADLFGLEERDGERRSLFRYYHGRSSLTAWLRAVLAQRVVDRARADKHLQPLPDTDAPGAEAETPSGASLDPHRPQYLASVRDALQDALDSLDPRDRLRLAMYYLQGVKLAAIGRVLGESEATVSRKLDRVRHLLREVVEQRLRAAGMQPAQVALAFEYAASDWPFDLGSALASRPPP